MLRRDSEIGSHLPWSICAHWWHKRGLESHTPNIRTVIDVMTRLIMTQL